MAAKLGTEFSVLQKAIDDYEVAARAWHASEPRYLPRALTAVLHFIETPLRWFR